jgi:hypothetical protein
VSEAPEKRTALKRWLRDRLTEGERPKEEWRQLWEATWEHLLATPVHDLIDAGAVKALADRLADPELIAELSRPIAATLAPAIIAEIREDEQPVGRFLPSEAQEKLQEILARPGFVHPDWVHAMFRGEAAEAVLNDALYRALHEFSTLLPRLLVKISPMGRFGVLGGAGALAEKLIEELEKLIEPEIKSFLAESTERVLERAADFTVAKIDDPASVEFRAAFVRFILSKSPAFYLEVADEELIGDIGEIAEPTVRHVLEMPDVRAQIQAGIDRVMDYSASKSLGEALQLEGSEARLPIDALAEATWPAFTTVLASPQAHAWIDTLLDELIDEYER